MYEYDETLEKLLKIGDSQIHFFAFSFPLYVGTPIFHSLDVLYGISDDIIWYVLSLMIHSTRSYASV